MNRRILKKIIVSLSLITLFVCVFASAVAAQTPPPTYTPLALPQTGNIVIRQDLTGLFLDIFKYTIAASAALAILQIIIGGVQYMSTEAWSGKGNSKEKIQQAIIGLLLVMLCFLILQTIDPRIVDISFLGKVAGPTAGQSAVTQTPTPQPKWCVPTFLQSSTEGFNEFKGFDCSKSTENECETQAIPYYSPGGPASRFCVAVFNQAGTKTAKEFSNFNCSAQNYNACEQDTKKIYLGNPGLGSRYCVAVFKKDGTYNNTDCIARTYNECESTKKPYWIGKGYSVTGTITYTDKTTGQFNGCFPKYTLTGTLKYESGETHDFNGCFHNYSTKGDIPGRGTVDSCITQEDADQLQYN